MDNTYTRQIDTFYSWRLTNSWVALEGEKAGFNAVVKGKEKVSKADVKLSTSKWNNMSAIS